MNMNNGHSESLTKELGKKYPCYVLITCEPPTEDGHMQVNMTYEGDGVLASYLVKGAQDLIDQDIMDENDPDASALRLVK